MAHYQLQTIRLDRIEFNPRQPRSDAELTDLASLGASFGDNPGAIQLAQLPVVYPLADGRYRVQMGERRIRAAQERGVDSLQLLVLDQSITLIERHRLSLLENLHRAALSVIDEAVGLKVAYFYENAVALGLQSKANAIMESAPDSFGVMKTLQEFLEEQGWKRTSPAVDWETCLGKLGLALNKQALLRRLYVLNLDTGVIERIQALSRTGTLDLSSASIRVIGKLDVAGQLYLLDAIAATPDIATKIRRITSKIEKGVYTIQEAVAEARGEVYLGDDEAESLPQDEHPARSRRVAVDAGADDTGALTAAARRGEDMADDHTAGTAMEEAVAAHGVGEPATAPRPMATHNAALDFVSDDDLSLIHI